MFWGTICENSLDVSLCMDKILQMGITTMILILIKENQIKSFDRVIMIILSIVAIIVGIYGLTITEFLIFCVIIDLVCLLKLYWYK